MVNVQCTATEAFLYSLAFVIVFFGIGYFHAWIDCTKGFSKKETEEIEKEVGKTVTEL